MRQSKRRARTETSEPEPLVPLLCLPDVCKMLHLSKPTVHHLIEHEGLPVIRFGRAVRIAPASLRQWLAWREKIA